MQAHKILDFFVILCGDGKNAEGGLAGRRGRELFELLLFVIHLLG